MATKRNQSMQFSGNTGARFVKSLPFWKILGELLIVLGLFFLASSVVAQSDTAISDRAQKAEAALWSNSGGGEIRQARHALEMLAQAGDAEAQRIIGQHLLNGLVLDQNVEQGLAWLEKAANGGNASAASELGQAYLWGRFVARDQARASQFLYAAAAKGDGAALVVLGEELVAGWTLPRNTERGLAMLEQAVARGDAKAQVVLGKLLLHGSGLSADTERAKALFEAAADADNGGGLVAYGEYLMWQRKSPAEAEAMLLRAAELGATQAWVTLAHGAMYGYLGGGSVSRAKFDGFAEKARAAGEDDIAVLEAKRNMWGISMRANGSKTLGRLRDAAKSGNVAAARFLIELLRDGNGLNIRRDLAAAAAALESYGGLIGVTAKAQYELTLAASKAQNRSAYRQVALAYSARPDLKSRWFGQEIAKANPNVAIYILQQKLQESGRYSGPLDGYAQRSTLRALYKACRTLDNPERCDHGTIRPDIIGSLLAL
ncbi:tetratricopeptide repeat protein [Marimonas sp. MJW-29]|uniref:Tetratricopeptide repeat protein n=1 Tax=Sulfitobacter sediminis TaxID=3234186 RepID=A0ABV3RP21_9RHOB